MTARDTLRQRITDALTAAVVLPGATPNAEEQAVLNDLASAVLPLTATAYRAAADELTAAANPRTERGAGVRWAADHLRARADEMEQQ
jgi:hypothetical protein